MPVINTVEDVDIVNYELNKSFSEQLKSFEETNKTSSFGQLLQWECLGNVTSFSMSRDI